MAVTRRILTTDDVFARLRSLCEGLSEFDSLKAETCIAALEAQLSTLKTLNQEYLRRANAVAQDHPPAGWVSVEDRDADWEKAIHAEFVNTHGVVLANIRARLKPAEKTPEERVTVGQYAYSDKCWYEARVDEKASRVRFDRIEDANTFATGLRAELKGAGE